MNFKKLAPLAVVVSLALPLVAMAQLTSHDNGDKEVWPPRGSVHELQLHTQDGKVIILAKNGAKVPVCDSTGSPILPKDLKTTSSKTSKSETLFFQVNQANVIQVTGAKGDAIGLHSCTPTTANGNTTFKPLSAYMLFHKDGEKALSAGQPTQNVHGGSGRIIKSATATQGSKSNTGAEPHYCIGSHCGPANNG
jgi:hypothetical protein